MASYTKTVVFTDLANYTQSTAKVDREVLRKLISDHEIHTRTLFDPDGGILEKNLGDSFMALFDSSTDALRACMDLVESTLSLGDKEMRFRASAATGDVEEIKGDYFGRRSYGSILGLSGMVQMAGSMLGPVFAAYVFDISGSYRIAFLSFSVLLIVSALLFLSLKNPQYR